MNEVSLKPVIDELETLFSKFNKAFFEGKLEKPVITVSPDHTRGGLWVVYRLEGVARRHQGRRLLRNQPVRRIPEPPL